MGKYEEAIKDYDKVIELNPQYDGAHYNRGVVKNYLGYYEEAIKDFDKAIELDPKNAKAFMKKGKALESLEKGRYKQRTKPGRRF